MFADVRGMFVDVRGRAWTCVDVRGARRGRSWMFVETPKLPSNCQWTCAIRNQSKLLGYYSNEPKNMKTEPNHKLNAQTRTISSAHCLLSSKLIALCEFSPCCLVCPPIPIKPTSNMSISHQTDSHMHTVVVHAIFNSTCRCCQSCMFRRADSAVGQGPRATLTQRKLIYKNCLIRSANFLMSALKFAP